MSNSTEKVFIFIDEYGNTAMNTDNAGTPSHFVYAAIVIKESDLSAARNIRNEISNLYFDKHAIKSKRIPLNVKGFNKRVNILMKLKELDFKAFTLVVDKEKAKESTKGIEYKQTFIKFFNKVFLKPFTKSFSSFEVYADKTGWPEFQRSLNEYLNRNVFQQDLFTPERSYRLVDDIIEEPLIQLADILAGCLGKIYCTSHSYDNVKSSVLFELLHDRLFVSFYPSGRINYEGMIKGNEDMNVAIQKIATESAIDAQNNKGALTDEAGAVLDYLLLIFKSNPSRIVETYEIVEKVKILFPAFTVTNLKRCIQSLRDRGVLIASIQGKSGYKLPNRVEDVVGFYNRNLNNIVPMINRINLCNTKLKLNKENSIDILDMDNSFATLRELIKAVEKPTK
jgi:hypothetical protein